MPEYNPSLYALKEKNKITLSEDRPIDGHLKSIKIGDKNSIMQLSDNELRVSGTLDATSVKSDGLFVLTPFINKETSMTKSATNPAVQIDFDHTGIVDGFNTVSNIGLDIDMNCDSVTQVSGTMNQTGIDINLVALADATQANTGVHIDVSGADTNYGLHIKTADKHIFFEHPTDDDDYGWISLADGGNLTIGSHGDGVGDGEIILDAEGDIELNAGGGQMEFKVSTNIKAQINTNGIGVPVGKRLMLDTDGSSHTYLIQSEDDKLSVYCGGDEMMIFKEALNYNSNVIDCLNSAVGFTQDEPTFDATDTEVLFSQTGNKQKLTLTDNCADIHFRFPYVSGNFICVLLQDGTGGRTISNWKTKDAAGNAGAGNSGLVLWAGGTAPTNTETANKADIVSFYWDGENEIAYGTYTYNF